MSNRYFDADAVEATIKGIPAVVTERLLSNRPTYFASFKTSEPVRYYGKGGRDALIQATLSSGIERIRPYQSRTTATGLFSFACKEGGAWTLHVIARHVSGQMDRPPAGFARALVRTHLEVINNPGAETARQIWSRKAGNSPRGFTIRLLDMLRQAGTPLEIINLQHITPDDAGRWVDSIFYLACQGWVSVNVEQPLTDQTLVSLGPLTRPQVDSARAYVFSRSPEIKKCTLAEPMATCPSSKPSTRDVCSNAVGSAARNTLLRFHA